MAKPPTIIELTWLGDLKFGGRSDQASITLDSAGLAGPSPVQALGFALAGCMTTDVAHILTKGRHPFRALRSHLVADRSPDEPHRFVRMTLHVSNDWALRSWLMGFGSGVHVVEPKHLAESIVQEFREAVARYR